MIRSHGLYPRQSTTTTTFPSLSKEWTRAGRAFTPARLASSHASEQRPRGDLGQREVTDEILRSCRYRRYLQVPTVPTVDFVTRQNARQIFSNFCGVVQHAVLVRSLKHGDCGKHHTDKPHTTNHKPYTTNHIPHTTNHKPQTTNLKPQTSNLRYIAPTAIPLKGRQ